MCCDYFRFMLLAFFFFCLFMWWFCAAVCSSAVLFASHLTRSMLHSLHFLCNICCAVSVFFMFLFFFFFCSHIWVECSSLYETFVRAVHSYIADYRYSTNHYESVGHCTSTTVICRFYNTLQPPSRDEFCMKLISLFFCIVVFCFCFICAIVLFIFSGFFTS